MVLYNLNSNYCFGILYRELKDDWTNSILMSYLPPFTTGEAYTHSWTHTYNFMFSFYTFSFRPRNEKSRFLPEFTRGGDGHGCGVS